MRTWWTWRQASTVIYFDPCSFRGLGTQVCQHCGRCIPQIGTFMPICPLCHSKGLGDGGDWHKAKQTSRKPKKQKKKTIFQRSWGWGGPTKSFQILFFCCFFLVFSMFFDFSPGVLPKETQSIFLCYHYMEVLLIFAVYGIKWWTDNLKSRQVERVLTKFKGCEPSCRKVQKVAALVGSGGGDRIYIIL